MARWGELGGLLARAVLRVHAVECVCAHTLPGKYSPPPRLHACTLARLRAHTHIHTGTHTHVQTTVVAQVFCIFLMCTAASMFGLILGQVPAYAEYMGGWMGD